MIMALPIVKICHNVRLLFTTMLMETVFLGAIVYENCKLRGFSSHDFRLPSAANAPIDFALEPGNGCQNDVTNSSQIIMDV